MLVVVYMPTSVGTDRVPRNLGGQLTKGLTVSLNYAILKKEELNWAFNLNLRHLKSEYTNMNQAFDNYNLENQSCNLTRYYNGGSPTALWAVVSKGIDPVTGREVFINKNGYETFVHNYDDEVIVGDSEAKVEGVLGSSFYYKGFTASVNFRYRLGGQIFMQTLYNKVENITSDKLMENQDKRALYDRWKQPGDIAKFKRISDTNISPMSSRFVEDNNILTCESVSFGYETEAKWLKNIGASSLNVRAYMNDIFRISTIKNERGIDYPFARSVSMSVGLRF
ncbi:MAG: hypothetical protein LIO65_04660 [Odoribacter sp.]|nr:hypothetical protein [Odoribacter sp.]